MRREGGRKEDEKEEKKRRRNEEKLVDGYTCRKVGRKLAHVMHKNVSDSHGSWERFLCEPRVVVANV